MKRILAIDLGGTNMRAATGHDATSLQGLCHEAAPQSLDAFTARVEALCREAAGAEALGIAVPGLVEGTTCRWVPNLPYLDGIDLGRLFVKMPVAVGNDAQIAMLAEAREGAAKGMSDAILLAIGTGIGSAVLTGGHIVAGARGGACSFGWASADLDDSGVERDGWLERTASGRALDRAARALDLADGNALVLAARAGNGPALEAVEQAARRLGVALAGAVGLLDPQAILVSGGIAQALDVVASPLLAALRRRLPPHLGSIDIRPAAFGARASLVGAALAGAIGSGWRRTG